MAGVGGLLRPARAAQDRGRTQVLCLPATRFSHRLSLNAHWVDFGLAPITSKVDARRRWQGVFYSLLLRRNFEVRLAARTLSADKVTLLLLDYSQA